MGGARPPRRGGRALPVESAFGNAFLHGIEQVLDDELSWKEKFQTDGEGLPPGYEHRLG